jgi:hypothetical protein
MRALLDMAGKVEFSGSGAELRGKGDSTALLVQEPSAAYAPPGLAAARVPRKARGT